ncbi:MAG: hypothetical protein ACI82O_002975, partial [Patiriisocius sp.]
MERYTFDRQRRTLLMFLLDFIVKIFKVNSRTLLLPLVIFSVLAGDVTAAGPVGVELGSAGSFAILSKTGITNVSPSAITGDVGTSPIAGASLLLTCAEVTGGVFTVDGAGPAPCAQSNASALTVAVADMGIAYTDAASRPSPDFIELGAGDISGMILVPGLYKWTSGLNISANVTFEGNETDTWIMQISGSLTQAVATSFSLAGGALAKNIIWQIAGSATIGTGSHFEGIILSNTMITVNTGASVNGRLFAQTAVSLLMNTVTEPAEAAGAIGPTGPTGPTGATGATGATGTTG